MLASGWQDDFTGIQWIGDQWLLRRETALLRVPSVVAAESWNYLLNPLHPDAAKVTIVRKSHYQYDRLFRR